MVTKLLTTGQVAERFAVHPATVARWADEGKLPVIHTPGGQRRFRPEDVDRFMRPQDAA
ncbi:MAG TPA: helix-turn-helix domain-containing protein [Nocardioidaceae bacterium]|nr:helix-turn-helix domain-containing protein [Nocardioidaceae bacterium]